MNYLWEKTAHSCGKKIQKCGIDSLKIGMNYLWEKATHSCGRKIQKCGIRAKNVEKELAYLKIELKIRNK